MATRFKAPVWPALAADHPLRKFASRLPDLLASIGYAEIWGITLSAAVTSQSTSEEEESLPPFHTLLILQKFLRANQNDIDKAYKQLEETLKWRKEFQPAKVLEEGGKDGKWEKFKGLGYITKVTVGKEGEEKKKVVAWNIYGAVKDFKDTFGDSDEFIRWRVSLMELSISYLSLASAITPIPDYDANNPTFDPYQTIQVHDYDTISFLRSPPEVKAASKKTIDLFTTVYPELLEKKYFVNVPAVMAWMFSAMKMLIPSVTRSKLVMLADGKALVTELGEGIPERYGGKEGTLEDVGITVEKIKAQLSERVEVEIVAPKDIATGNGDINTAAEQVKAQPSAEAVPQVPATSESLQQDPAPAKEEELDEKKQDKGKQPERECYQGACQEEGFPEELKKDCCGKCVDKGKNVEEAAVTEGTAEKANTPVPVDFTTAGGKNGEEKEAEPEKKGGEEKVEAQITEKKE